MSEAVVLGLAGIVVSGVVGPWLSARWNLQTKRVEYNQDRALQDLEELRAVLDGMAKSVAAVYSIFGSAVSWLQTVKPDETDEGMHATVVKAVTDVYGPVVALGNDVPRLMLRLGARHPVLEGYLAFSHELTVWMGARFDGTVPLPAEREEELAAMQEAVNRTYAVFFDAGFRMVGSDVTPD